MKTDKNVRQLLFAELTAALPPEVRTSLLADRSFCEKFGIKPRFSFLVGERPVDIGSLHKALRAAVAGHKSALLTPADGDRFRVKLGFRKGGQATIRFQRRGFAFNDADLLSRDLRTRGNALNRVFATRPLLVDEENRWKKIARQRPFTDWEYIELITALNATPEALRTRLGMPGQLDVESLIPDKPGYYNSLTAQLRVSENIHAFIAGELADNRQSLLKRHPTQALRRMAFTALWRPLVPFDLLGSLKPSDARALLDAEDPFSLLFCFELCCGLLPTDTGFVDLGTACLDKLLDVEMSQRRCHMFSALALISGANIRRVTKASQAPVFWARLAALAHAGVLTDALADIAEPEKFLQWSGENFYPVYRWHGMVDRRDAPRWSPDWITPDHIHAELVGRARIALFALAERDRPAEWVSATDSALSRLADTGKYLQAVLPGPFDDFYEDPNRSMVPVEIFAKTETELETATYLNNVSGMIGFAYSGKLTDEALENVLRILKRPVDEAISSDGRNNLQLLHLCAHICGVSRSEPVAGAIIDRCLYAVRSGQPAEQVPDVFAVVVEACAAYRAGRKYREILGSTAAQLCFAVPDSEDLSDLWAVFDVLGDRDETLIPALARAKAIVQTRLHAA
jgi:hypothetical protein